MPSYVYTALDANGKEKKGNVIGETEAEAIEKVKAQKLTVLKIEEANALNSEISLSFVQKQPKGRDMSVFCRQMVSILSAGVSMAQALDMLGEQTENKTLAEAIKGCKKKIESGSSMHEAMEDYACMRGIFSTMIAAGEESGSLETSFDRMAVRFEKDEKMKALVKKATMYPIIVVIVAVVVVVFMLIFLVPKFEDLLGQMGTEMPALTKAVVGASRFFVARFYIIIPVIIAIIVGLKFLLKLPGAVHFVDTLKLKIPLFGNLTTKTACSNVTRTLATLLASGIGMIEAVDICKSVMTNTNYINAMDDIKTEVSQGTPLSEAFERTGLFPPMITHMTKIGEETGQMIEMFDRCAEYYDEEVQAATEALTAAIEPMVIVLLAGVVGTILIALMMPMLSMYTGLDNL